MAVTIACDGCGVALPTPPSPIGRYDPVIYCPGCQKTYDALAADLDAIRVALTTEIALRRAARIGQARLDGLARLPDEAA